MNRLEQILEGWEAETLTGAELAEWKQLLGTREGRAGLVDNWLLDEAIYDALRARPEEASEPAPAPAQAPAPAATAVRSQAGPGRRRRMFGWLVWHETRISIGWPLGLAGAACILLAGFYYYFQKAAAGQIAAADPMVVVERGGRRLGAQAGQPVYPGDVVRVPAGGTAAIAWAGESTRLELSPGTDLELENPMRGKRLRLRQGVVEAMVAPQSVWRPMVVATREASAKVVGTHFALAATGAVTRLEVFDGAVRLHKVIPGLAGDPTTVTVHGGEAATAAPGVKLEVRSLTGLTREVWAVPAGAPLSEAAVRGTLLTGAVAAGTSTVERLRGYVVAPETGDYTFWVGSRGGTKAVELWLSLDQDPARNRRIAYFQPQQGQVPGPTVGTGGGRGRTLQPDWHRSTSQQSAPQRLVAGRRYYLELWHEGADMNLVGLGWKRPGEAADREPSMIDHASLFPLPGATSGAEGAK